MDVWRLDELVGEYVRESVAPSTRRVYASGQRRYLSFSLEVGRSPFPLNEQKLCRFVVYLAESGLQHSSIKGYLSAVRRLQVELGLGDPCMSGWPLLECAVKGVKLRQAKNVKLKGDKRLPITPTILRSLKSFWERNRERRENIMLWAGEITISSSKEYDPGYTI